MDKMEEIHNVHEICCKTCSQWTPKYRWIQGILFGACLKIATQRSKFNVLKESPATTNGDLLLTKPEFYCNLHEE